MALAGGIPAGIEMSLICMVVDGDMGKITGEEGQAARLLRWESVGGDVGTKAWVCVSRTAETKDGRPLDRIMRVDKKEMND